MITKMNNTKIKKILNKTNIKGIKTFLRSKSISLVSNANYQITLSESFSCN